MNKKTFVITNKHYNGFIYDKLQFKYMNYTINSIKNKFICIFVWFYTKYIKILLIHLNSS